MINPKDDSPFALKPQTLPRVRVERGAVIVRLELVSLRDHLDVRDIELVLPRDIALTLGQELVEAARKLV
jgi:hypothetical protein